MTPKLSLIPFFFLLAACAANPGVASTATQAPTVPPKPTETTMPTSTPLPTQSDQPASNISPAQEAAVLSLSAQLALPVDQIRVVRSEAVEWPDGCLGLAGPGVMCIQVITPGYRVTLEANGQTYLYHTNTDGSLVILNPGAPPTYGAPVFHWSREGGIAGFCDEATVYESGAVELTSCRPGGVVTAGQLHSWLTPKDVATFEAWRAKFGVVTIEMKDDAVADAMSTSLVLTGTGTAQPTEAEQQALLAWAQKLLTGSSTH